MKMEMACEQESMGWVGSQEESEEGRWRRAMGAYLTNVLASMQ